MQTYTGRMFWPIDPRPEEIEIEDIAHALSMICRFGGHVRQYYSVAEHSVRVSAVVEAMGGTGRHPLAGLLHDATEAYLGDMIRPLKTTPEMKAYRDAEKRLAQAVCDRFKVFYNLATPLIRTADEILLATEARDLMGGESAAKWELCAEPMDEVIVPWAPAEARARYLDRYHELAAR